MSTSRALQPVFAFLLAAMFMALIVSLAAGS
jgi:hypothetical protein